MILRRLRSRAGWVIFGLMLFVGVALAASANQPVTESQMRSFVYERLAVAGVLVLGAGAGLIAWILAHDRSANISAMERDRSVQREQFKVVGDSIAAVARSVESLAKAMEHHDESPYSHRSAAEHNHKSIECDISTLGAKMDAILRDCEAHRCGYGPRDPHDSPCPRRETDPLGFDATDVRGKR